MDYIKYHLSAAQVDRLLASIPFGRIEWTEDRDVFEVVVKSKATGAETIPLRGILTPDGEFLVLAFPGVIQQA